VTGMPPLLKAKFHVFKKDGSYDTIDVQYNPEKLGLEKAPKIAEIPIPGIDAPLQQFVRGQSETLTVELFFDSTEHGTGTSAHSVTEQTDKFYGLVKIDPQTHAPPVCSFIWGTAFPGDSLPTMYQNQRRSEFKGLVTKVKQDFALFSPNGTPLRATLTLTMDEYRPLHDQLQQLNLQSADHTRSHVVEDGDTLPLVSWEYLQKPAQWRAVADANDVDDPRRISVGSTYVIPPVGAA
jgi:nucleoid-associated protein YgaU